MNTTQNKLAKGSLSVAICLALGTTFSAEVLAQSANVTNKGGVMIYTVPAVASQADAPDIANAIPMPQPSIDTPPSDLSEGNLAPQSTGKPGVLPGKQGDGKLAPVALPSPSTQNTQAEEDAVIVPQEYGTANVPYTTSRVDLGTSNVVSLQYPYRAAGKLYFKDGASTYVCSASLIKRGVIVTAAHCVASFGNKRFYTNWQFVPAQFGNTAPYGVWNAAYAMVMSSYYNGTDSCAVRGVVCQNDVAVIRLAPQAGAFPGTRTGWFGYGWNGWGFVNNITLINQLGYPVSHDSGLKMQRTDSQGAKSAANSNNTVWGGRQTGGSSGGPELVNLGWAATLSGTGYGAAANYNTVVGVTSWGYTSTVVKLQGASPFTSTNIVPLVSAACPAGQAACL
jgi:V8-like Glu-specific endopeptidase